MSLSIDFFFFVMIAVYAIVSFKALGFAIRLIYYVPITVYMSLSVYFLALFKELSTVLAEDIARVAALKTRVLRSAYSFGLGVVTNRHKRVYKRNVQVLIVHSKAFTIN